MQITILSWNVQHGKRLQDCIAFLAMINPDIIGLQEVIQTDIDGIKHNTASIIADALGYESIYYSAFTNDRSDQQFDLGNAILSRWKPISYRCHVLSSLKTYQASERSSETEPRIAVEVNLAVQGTIFHVFNTHLAYSHAFQPSAMRYQQTKNLLKVIPDTKTILLGDFNAPKDQAVMDAITARLKNADPAPTDPTWPLQPVNKNGFIANRLSYRLDHIFASNDIEVADFRIYDSDASDHLPMGVTVVL